MSNGRAIIFDLDNTLIDTNRAISNILFDAMHVYLKEMGHPLDAKLISTTVNDRLPVVLKKNLSFEKIFDELFGATEAPKVLSTYRSIAKTHKFAPRIHMPEFVRDTHGLGYTLGILTNRVSMAETRLLEAGYNREHFLFIVSPAIKKPAPGCFNEVFEALSGMACENITFIGDHMDDFLAAKNHGVPFSAAIADNSTSYMEFAAAGCLSFI